MSRGKAEREKTNKLTKRHVSCPVCDHTDYGLLRSLRLDGVKVTPDDINWIVSRAMQRGYPIPSAFMSSKPDAGINHKTYGVTSEGVQVNAHAVLSKGRPPLSSFARSHLRVCICSPETLCSSSTPLTFLLNS